MLNGRPRTAILLSRQNGTTRRARLLEAVEGTQIRVTEQSLFRVLTLLVAVCEQTLLELDATAQPGEDSDLAHAVAATLGASERLLRSPRFAHEYSAQERSGAGLSG